MEEKRAKDEESKRKRKEDEIRYEAKVREEIESERILN